MNLSKEKQINLVSSHKKKIVELTNRILTVISETSKKYKFDNEQKLLLKQLINETVSQIATIVSFCGSKERNWINNTTMVIAIQNINLTYSSRHTTTTTPPPSTGINFENILNEEISKLPQKTPESPEVPKVEKKPEPPKPPLEKKKEGVENVDK